MEARLLTDTDLPAYQNLVNANGKVFYTANWRGVLGSALRIYGIFAENGELAGGIQLLEERRLGLRFLRNPPFTPVCGPLFAIKAQHPVAVLEARRKVLETVAAFLVGQSRCVISLSLDHELHDVMPFCWQGFKATPRYSYRIDLRQPLEVIVKGFSPSRRNDISKARRDGLTVEPADDLRVVSDLVKQSFGRQTARLDVAVLDSILFRYARPENSFGFVTRRSGRPIACTFLIQDRDTAYYLLGGYAPEYRHHGAGALAVFESIQEAQRRGLITFDFEGSMIPAIERFFRGFGGNLVHFFTVNRAWLPFEMVLKFWKRSLF